MKVTNKKICLFYGCAIEKTLDRVLSEWAGKRYPGNS